MSGDLGTMGAMEVPGMTGEQVPAARVREDRGLQMRGIVEVAVQELPGALGGDGVPG